MTIRALMVVPHGWLTGANRSLVNLVAAAPRDELEPIVVFLRDGAIRDEILSLDVETHFAPRGRRLRHAHGSAAALAALRDIVRRTKPDVVYGSESMGSVFGAPVARIEDLPMVWRQPSWPNRLPLELAATAMPADAVIVASEAVAAAQRRLPGSPPVHLIAPGIELVRPSVTPAAELRARYRIPAAAPLVGIVGRLDVWKGQDVFLRAAALVAAHRPEVRFAVVGGVDAGEDEHYADGLHRLARDLGIRDRVVFTGATSEVPAWMNALDVSVNASIHEPFGLVIVESLWTGCPVVAVDEAGPSDILDDGTTGLLVAERSPAAFAGAIGRLVDDPELRARLGEAGPGEVARRFGRERMAQEFSALFGDVVGRRRAKRTRLAPRR